MIARGFGTAAVLMALVVILFAIARLIGGRGPGQLTSRQRRTRQRKSQEDAYRYLGREAAAKAALPETRATHVSAALPPTS